MNYCPHCSAHLPKPVKVCPFCKRTVDLEMITSVYKPGESSQIDKKMRRKIWIREKLIIILPLVAIIAGFVIGAIVMFIYSQTQFAADRNDYENQIDTLQAAITARDQSAANSRGELNQVIAEKDLIIASLTEQAQIYSRMVGFTNRLARSSTITPNSPQEIDYFQRNVRYLQSLFNQEQEKLNETGYDTSYSYNLIPIPQLLE